MARALHYTLTAALGLAGAYLFQWLHIPMPWLLGPLVTILVLQLTTPLPLKWTKHFRDFGLVLAGYSIGHAFTMEAVADIQRYLPLMIGLNALYIGLFLLISWWIVKRTQVDRLTAMTSVVPGGMSQIVVYAEEQGSQHMTMITFYQVLRVLCILGLVPLLVAGDAAPITADDALQPLFFVFLIFSIVAGKLATMCKIPTGFMLGPVLLFMGLQFAQVDIPAAPVSALHLAQLVIGIYIALLLKRKDLHVPKKVVFYAFASAFLYIGSAYAIAQVVMHYYPLDFKTSFLSIVPGGLDQMGIISASVQADSAVVTAFQLFRVLVISFLVIPAIKYMTKSSHSK